MQHAQERDRVAEMDVESTWVRQVPIVSERRALCGTCNDDRCRPTDRVRYEQIRGDPKSRADGSVHAEVEY